MKNKFDFYEVVVICENHDVDLAGLTGQRGAVLGMAQDDETGLWVYAVSLDSTGDVWNVGENHLTATGEAKERSDFYSGDSIEVKVDRETGEGSFG